MKKFLCFGLTFLMDFGFSYAMENKISNKDEFISILAKDENKIGKGLEGEVFYSKEFPNLVLKKINNVKSNTTIECLKKLEGKDLGKNLMKVEKIYDDKNIVFEYIDGIRYYDTIEIKFNIKTRTPDFHHKGLGNIKLSLDFFLDNWCIGIIQGMQKLKDLTGYYLTDRNSTNFMIRNPKTSEPILTLIDYDFSISGSQFSSFVTIFKNIMELNVDKNDTRWEKLYKYLDSIKTLDFEPENVKNLLDNLQKIRNKLD